MGGEVERHSRGNPGEGLGPQEKQGATVGRGERRRGRPPWESPRARALRLSEGGRLPRRLPGVRSHLLRPRETGRFLCRLRVARHLLCGLGAAGG